jgi:hypothetical protein
MFQIAAIITMEHGRAQSIELWSSSNNGLDIAAI